MLLTVATWVIYKQRYYPRSTYDDRAVSGQKFSAQTLTAKLPEKITFQTSEVTVEVRSDEAGLSADSVVTLQSLRRERRLRPLLITKLFRRHQYGPGVTINDEKFSKFVSERLRPHEHKPVDAHLAVDKEQVTIANPTIGNEVDQSKLKNLISSSLTAHHTSFTVPYKEKKGVAVSAQLKKDAEKLNTNLGQSVKIAYTGGVYEPTRGEKAAWLTASGVSLTFDKTKMSTFIDSLQKKLGKSWDNTSTISVLMSEKLNAGFPVTVSMHDKPIALRTYSYCVALRNVGEEFRAGFEAKLRSTYADDRGWGLNGKIAFVQVSSGCNFTVWLSSAASVPSFGAICDSAYSCTVSPNVIINFDRWQGATDPWNAAGGSLDDYRSMVINHETGHWLGFGHQNCPAAGQPAPVMQQQSVGLQGCKFNPWPLPSELTNLSNAKGI